MFNHRGPVGKGNQNLIPVCQIVFKELNSFILLVSYQRHFKAYMPTLPEKEESFWTPVKAGKSPRHGAFSKFLLTPSKARASCNVQPGSQCNNWDPSQLRSWPFNPWMPRSIAATATRWLPIRPCPETESNRLLVMGMIHSNIVMHCYVL